MRGFSAIVGALMLVPAMASAQAWVATGNLATGRAFPLVVALPDGRVLVVGGRTGAPLTANGTALVEIFAPARGQFTADAPMSTPRTYGTATLLPDGRVLVAGGEETTAGPSLASAEIRDASSGVFVATGALGTSRHLHTANLLNDGKVVVIGGIETSGASTTLQSAERWDPATGQWTATAGLLVNARVGHASTRLRNGKIVVSGGSAAASAEELDPATGLFAAAGTLVTARSEHTATLLPDGRILVAGGCTVYDPIAGTCTGTVLGTSETWNPETRVWTTTTGSTPSMGVARWRHSATLLPDGKVLVTGGVDAGGNAVTTTEVFNPATAAWTTLASAPLSTARASFGCVVLPGGRVVAIGGAGATGALTSAEVYDPRWGVWTSTGAMTPRGRFAMVTLADGRVLVAGGAAPPTVALKKTEVYDPAAGTWNSVGDLFTERRRAGVTLLPSGKVLIAGGCANIGSTSCTPSLKSAEVFDPLAGTWSATGGMAKERYYPIATLLGDGRVLLSGGFDGTAGISVKEAEIWDPALGGGVGGFTATGSQVAVNGSSTGRYLFAASLLLDGRVLVSGGTSDPCAGCTYTSAEIYDPATSTWSATGIMGSPRNQHTSTLLPDGRVLVTGGRDNPNATAYATAEIWNPETGTWTPTAGSMSVVRYDHTATLLPDGRILLAGGCTSFSGCPTTASVEIYDPATDRFSDAGTVTSARARAGAALLRNGILAAGGESGGAGLGDVRRFKPTPSPSSNRCEPYLSPPGSSGLPAGPWPSGVSIKGYGVNLTGCSEGNGGGSQSGSPSSFPQIRFVSLASGTLWSSPFTQARSWDSGVLTFSVPGDAGLVPGMYLLQTFVNGVADQGRLVRLTRSHEKYYHHREPNTGTTRYLCVESPSAADACGAAHTQTATDLCRELGSIGPLRVEDAACPPGTTKLDLIYPPGGFSDPHSISGPWTFRVETRRPAGGAAAGRAWFFARIRRQSDGWIIHETVRRRDVNLPIDLSTTAREMSLQVVIPPRATDISTCPAAPAPCACPNGVPPCASTTLPAGGQVRVEWWVDVEETSARQVLFALERPGSTASSFAVRTQEELTAAGPTAAHLGDFRARWRSGDVVASWRLEVAEGVARIQLQRAIAEDGPWDPVGDAFGADAISPSYEVVDVQPRAPSLYRVELVTDDGVIELYGPIRPEEEPVTGCTCRTVTNRRVSHAAILLLVVLALAWRRPRA